MDNERKYKEALGIAKNIYGASESKDILSTLTTIFPELAESEDEKIRKTLIEYFNAYPKDYYCELKTSSIIAWLEKQGEQEEPQVYETEDGEVITYSETDGYKVVEPKFKVGDWIVDNCGYTWKIEGILNQFYILEDVEGGESRPTIEWVDKTCHLWILKDAKAGDVLATDNSVFIYAKVLCNKPYAYCGVDKFGVFKDNCLKHDWSNSVDNIHPSTKEQRDLLLQKMKEAGYTFDSDKKELKKIENKPLVIDEGKAEMDYCFTKMMNGEKVSSYWSEDDEKMVKDIIAAIDTLYYHGIVNWLKSLKYRVQPKQEWSEDDKGNMLVVKCIIDKAWHNQDFREDTGYSSEELESLWNWFDNIWQRVKYPQNTWKPSEEQMEQLKNAANIYPDSRLGHGLKTLYEELNKLKKL